MANLNHTLAIPGYILILVVFWGWLPIFLICWVVRKIAYGPLTPDQEAQQFPRPAPGWLGPDVGVDEEDSLNDESDEKQYDRLKEAEKVEMRRRYLDKKRRAKQIKREKMKEWESQQRKDEEEKAMAKTRARATSKGREVEHLGEPRRLGQMKDHESLHHRR